MAVPSARPIPSSGGKGSLSREIGDKVSFPKEARRAKFARHSRFAPSSSFLALNHGFLPPAVRSAPNGDGSSRIP